MIVLNMLKLMHFLTLSHDAIGDLYSFSFICIIDKNNNYSSEKYE